VTYSGSTAFLHGPKTEARRRLAACGDSSPLWVARRGAWATSIPAANRVVDQLEARNIRVAIEHADQAALDLSATEPANIPPERQGVLW
jgi:hypothetical protein